MAESINIINFRQNKWGKRENENIRREHSNGYGLW